VKSRAAQLRETHRKVFAWSILAALAAHVAVFLLSPDFRAEPIFSSHLSEVEGGPGGAPMRFDLLFGPPTLSAADGTPWTEPEDRILPARRAVHPPMGCQVPPSGTPVPFSGRVRLRVDASGHATVLELVERTGDGCADEVLAIVAGDLWYRWLPNDRFPAPVVLVQPVTLMEVRN
jgi:hypothetical protein